MVSSFSRIGKPGARKAWISAAKGLVFVLVIAACGNGATDTSVSTPPTTLPPAPAATAPAPVVASSADVVASIDALMSTPRFAFTVTSELSVAFLHIEVISEGILDSIDGSLSLSFELGPDVPELVRSELVEAGLADMEMIYSEERGLLTRVEGVWRQLPAEDLASMFREVLGFPIPGDELSLPGIGPFFDLVSSDPGLVKAIEPNGETRTIDGREVSGFTFQVPGTAAAVALVAADLVPIAMLAPIENTDVAINWWLDLNGRVRVVEIVGDEVVGDVLVAVAEAYPGSEFGFAAPMIDGATITLAVTTADKVPRIEYPDPSIVEQADLSELSEAGLALRPGSCLPSYQAALLPLGQTIIDCSIPHGGEVFAVFDVPEADVYPGEDPVFEYGSALCWDQAPAYTDEEHEFLVLYPTAASWALGDRLIVCVFEFEELQEASVARVPLDLAGTFALQKGQCLPFGDELAFVLLPLVDCSQPHGFEVIEVAFVGRWERAYPGDGPIRSEAIELCEAVIDSLDPEREFSTIYYMPDRDSWAWGDRTVACLAESSVPVTGSLLSS